jgi:hypothetical protein
MLVARSQTHRIADKGVVCCAPRQSNPPWLLWQWDGSPSPAIPNDMWGGRFTFYFAANRTGNYTFTFSVDDQAALYVDGVWQGNHYKPVVVPLVAGQQRQFVITYHEAWGWVSCG